MMAAGAGMAVFALGACGGPSSDEARERQIEEYAAQYGVDADVEIENGEVSTTINTGGGQVGSDLDLPAGFPDDVAVFPELTIHAAMATPGQVQGYMIQAQTESAVSDIVDFYAREMANAGWEPVEPEATAPTMERLGFKKGERLTTVVIIDTGAMKTVQLSTMVMPS